MALNDHHLSRERVPTAQRSLHQSAAYDSVLDEPVPAFQAPGFAGLALTPGALIGLQRAIGNRAVSALVAPIVQRQTAQAMVQRVMIAGIDVRPSGNMPTWDQGGGTYHINLTTDTYHVTKVGVPKIQYFFKGTGNDIVDTQPTGRERGKSKKKVKGVKGKVNTKTVFSALPDNVQTFIKANFANIIAVR